MKIKLSTIYAGPNGTIMPGERDVNADLGKQLIDAGCAVEIESSAAPNEPPAKRETASIEQEETATTIPDKKPKKR